MASTPGRNPLKAGLILNVEVENALDGVIMVCLRHEGRAFRGILLDSDNGSCPAGLPSKDVLTKDLNDKFGVPDNDIATIEADVVRQDPHSALSYRQSYFQNMPLPPARPLLRSKSQSSPKQKLGPTYTTRTRPLKLRPRQNLCSNCKEQCSKTKAVKRKLVPAVGGHLTSKKSRVDPVNNATAKKSVKKAKVHSLKKTLKITYATPQGKDQVTISPRSSGDGTKIASISCESKVSSVRPVKSEEVKSVLPSVDRNSAKKVSSKPKEKRRITVNGFHRHHKKSELKLNVRAANPKTLSVETKHTSLNLPGEKDNSLSNDAAKEIITNGLKVHLVEELFVPCLKARSVDTSSESSFASSVSSNKSRRRPKADAEDTIIQPELSDSEKEIEFKIQPQITDILGSKSDDDQQKRVPPLNLKVHKKNVTKYRLADGRTMCLGDIVWGKIQGSPWWPARISQIVVSRRDNGAALKQEALIRWMGAKTVSHMPLETLFPFLPYFKQRFNRKRRGVYKHAISQAMEEAKAVSPEVRALHTMFETSEIC